MAGAFVLPSSASTFNIEGHVPVFRAHAYAQQHWPNADAGWWVEESPDHPTTDPILDAATFHFAFTEGAVEKVAKLRERFPGVNPYAAHNVKFTWDHLNTLGGQVSRSLYAIYQGMYPDWQGPVHTIFFVGLSAKTNDVNVSFTPPPEDAEFMAWLESSDFETWKAQWPPEVTFSDDSGSPSPVPDQVFPANSTVLFDPPLPPGVLEVDRGDPATTNKKPAKARDSRRTTAKRKHRLRAKRKLMRKNRRQVRKCKKARRSGSAKHRKFSKSKKCRKARTRLKRARAKHA